MSRTARNSNFPNAVAVVASLALTLGGLMPDQVRAAQPEPNVNPVSKDAVQVAGWVMGTGDNNGVPFMIVDKVSATVLVYDAEGQLLGAGPALLGLAPGDDSAPGIGDRELSAIRPEERTTPAGRFLATFGPAKGRERVLWVDFPTAISMHPVVTTNRKEHRLERLASTSVDDNRITYGCINVAEDFYKGVVEVALNGTRAVVYVLPESRALSDIFPSLAGYMLMSSSR